MEVFVFGGFLFGLGRLDDEVFLGYFGKFLVKKKRSVLLQEYFFFIFCIEGL